MNPDYEALAYRAHKALGQAEPYGYAITDRTRITRLLSGLMLYYGEADVGGAFTDALAHPELAERMGHRDSPATPAPLGAAVIVERLDQVIALQKQLLAKSDGVSVTCSL